MAEKFSLKWNDYQSNWNRALHELREDTDFADVTLISDDKLKFSAHRVLLSSCSNLFKLILKSNTHANPLLYLGGINSINLGFILDYIYHGEVNIYQEQLDSFLESAQKLEIEGLLGQAGDNQDSKEDLNEEQNVHQHPDQNVDLVRSDQHSDHYEERSIVKIDNDHKMRRQVTRAQSKDVAKFNVESLTKEEIKRKIGELYERTDGGWRCLVCDHTNSGQMSSNIRMHVEIHLDGLVYTCKLCSKEFRCRNDLNNHKTSTHKK